MSIVPPVKFGKAPLARTAASSPTSSGSVILPSTIESFSA